MMTIAVPCRLFVCLAWMVAVTALAGCSSVTDPGRPADPGAANTGAFPNLNIAPRVAAPQFSPDDQASSRAFLARAKGEQAQPASTTAASPEELRKIAYTHGKNTLDAIAAQ